jgi:hypothetical protein
MPWHRREPDPFQAQREKLVARERQLAAERARLTAELQQAVDPESAPRAPEPPVWRLEDEAPPETPARRKALAHQRRRDMLIFFVCMGLLFAVIAVWLWIYNTHNAAAGGM